MKNKRDIEVLALKLAVDNIAASIMNCLKTYNGLNELYAETLGFEDDDVAKVKFCGSVVLGVTRVLNTLIDNAPVNDLGKRELAKHLNGMFTGSLNDYSTPEVAKESNKYSIRICELDAPLVGLNVLLHVGIETVGDLLNFNKATLLKLPHFGKKSYYAIVEGLEKLGLHLPEKSTMTISEFNMQRSLQKALLGK